MRVILIKAPHGKLVACADEVQAEQVRQAVRYASMVTAAKRLPPVPDVSGN